MHPHCNIDNVFFIRLIIKIGPGSLFIRYTIRYNFGRVCEPHNFRRRIFSRFPSFPIARMYTLRINRPNDLLTLFLQFVPITMFSYPIYGQQNNFRNGFKTRRYATLDRLRARSIQSVCECLLDFNLTILSSCV